jgi:hypothetical protein
MRNQSNEPILRWDYTLDILPKSGISYANQCASQSIKAKRVEPKTRERQTKECSKAHCSALRCAGGELRRATRRAEVRQEMR